MPTPTGMASGTWRRPGLTWRIPCWAAVWEARAYLADPVLGGRLREISAALLALPGDDPTAVLGWPDDMKVCSCMTLFALAAEENSVFHQVLEKYYNGERDGRTLEILGLQG